MVAQRRHMSETESEVEEPGAKAMQMQQHPTPPIDPPNACVTFLRGAMGSRFHAARPGGPPRLRERLCRSRGRGGLLGAPRWALAASQSLRALRGGWRPARWPPLPSGGQRQAFGENPYITPGPRTCPSHCPLPPPSQEAPRWWAVAGRVWGLAVIKGFSRGPDGDEDPPWKAQILARARQGFKPLVSQDLIVQPIEAEHDAEAGGWRAWGRCLSASLCPSWFMSLCPSSSVSPSLFLRLSL